MEKGPKSISSQRTVDMPNWYMDELAVYRQECEQEKEDLGGDEWKGEDRQYVCTTARVPRIITSTHQNGGGDSANVMVFAISNFTRFKAQHGYAHVEDESNVDSF